MKLLLATRNKHKVPEIKSMLGESAMEIVTMDAFPEQPDVVEDAATFEANAVKKAVTLAMATGLWTLADDSGLEVEALGGRPGVRSARYAGEPVNYAANNAKLLKEMEGKTDRRARFRCVIALCSPGGRCQIVSGDCEGTIIDAERGVQGFGYDPLFVPEGHTQTFAEMELETKNGLSHRANALRRAISRWSDWLRDGEKPPW